MTNASPKTDETSYLVSATLSRAQSTLD